jgi:hypothetical protein
LVSDSGREEYDYDGLNVIYDIKDNTVTDIIIDNSSYDYIFNLPEKTANYARNFILRIEVKTTSLPSITFNGLDQSWFAESADESWMILDYGVNVLTFTEIK